MNKENITATLLLHCADTPGIISEIARFITTNKGNIVYLDQHVDQVDHEFFMRIEFELSDFLIPRDKILEYINTLFSSRYGMTTELYFSDQIYRMAIFVSRMSHCLYDLLSRYSSGEWKVEIPCIISNHEDLHPVAKKFGIPYHVFPISKNKENLIDVEAEQIALLKRERISLIVLARYMQILSKEFTSQYPNNIINIHHSSLPAFIGAKPYQQAWERGVKIIGATAHYVTSDLDAGPIISQDVVPITHKDTPATLTLKGKDLEKIVLSRAISKHLDRKILTYRNRTVIFS